MPDTTISTLQVAPKTGTPLATPAGDRGPNDSPDFTRDEVTAFAAKRARCHHLMGGTDAMWANATTYLPKWPGEDDETYAVRSTLTELYNAFERTVSAAGGLVFAKEPALDASAPDAITEQWEDIDGQGTHASVFLKSLFDAGLQDGLVGILVDYPKVVNPGALSLADAQAQNLRPRWVPYCSDQIINWRTTKIGGKIVLTLLVLSEEVDEDSGEFGSTCTTQYRAIRREVTAGENGVYGTRISYQIWRKRVVDKKIEWYVFDEGEYRGVSGIPFAVAYIGRRTAYMQAMPPLSALAEVNVGNYRVSADRRYLMSIVHSPTPVITHWSPGPRRADGQEMPDEGQMKVGPGASMKLVGEQDFKWVQAEAAGLQSSKEEKDDQKAEMASLSIAFLAQERKAAETATAHRINSTAQNATLSSAATGLSDCTEQALVFHCEYLGIDAPPGVTIEVTYDEEKLDAQTIAALDQLAKDGNITRKTLLLILQDGDILPDTVDVDEEDALLDAQHRELQDAQASAASRAAVSLGRSLGGGNRAGSNTGSNAGGGGTSA